MAAIRFIVDYRGVLTNERYYQAGDVAELDNAIALVNEGRAEHVELPQEADGLDRLTRKQLRAMAKEAGLSRYGQLNKAALIAQLRDNYD